MPPCILTCLHVSLQKNSEVYDQYCQAQPQLNSTQLKLRLRWSLFPFDPATHPHTPTHPPTRRKSFTHPCMTVSKEVRLMTSSRLLQDYFKTILDFQFNWGWVFLMTSSSSTQLNGILPHYIFRSYDKMSDVYDQYFPCRAIWVLLKFCPWMRIEVFRTMQSRVHKVHNKM